MAHKIAKLLLEHADSFLERTEAIKSALQLGMPLSEIEEYLDWLDTVRRRVPDPQDPADQADQSHGQRAAARSDEPGFPSANDTAHANEAGGLTPPCEGAEEGLRNDRPPENLPLERSPLDDSVNPTPVEEEWPNRKA